MDQMTSSMVVSSYVIEPHVILSVVGSARRINLQKGKLVEAIFEKPGERNEIFCLKI
jgi:hypothetical protein